MAYRQLEDGKVEDGQAGAEGTAALPEDVERHYTGLTAWWQGLSRKAKENIKDGLFVAGVNGPAISSEVGYAMLVGSVSIDAFTMPFDHFDVALPPEVTLFFKVLAWTMAVCDATVCSSVILEPRDQRANLTALNKAYAEAFDKEARSNKAFKQAVLWISSTVFSIAYGFGATSPIVGLYKLFGNAPITIGLGTFWFLGQAALYTLTSGQTPVRFADFADKLFGDRGAEYRAELFSGKYRADLLTGLVGAVTRGSVFAYSGFNLLSAFSSEYSPQDFYSQILGYIAGASAAYMMFGTMGLKPIFDKMDKVFAAKGSAAAPLLQRAEGETEEQVLAQREEAKRKEIISEFSERRCAKGIGSFFALITFLAYCSRALNMPAYLNAMGNRHTAEEYSPILAGIGLVLGVWGYVAWLNYMKSHAAEAVTAFAATRLPFAESHVRIEELPDAAAATPPSASQ